jgi:EAL domain-containing protein (putative c-di-GMP-specific phosphodiesterase class I)
MKASCVGVENIDQYMLLKEIDEDILMQGFYFHRPLERQAFIEAVRGNNKFNKK